MAGASVFEPSFHVRRLSRFPALLRALIEDIDDEAMRWKPDPESWAIVEVLGHLVREEREDFRPRLERTLRDPTEPWPTMDPQGDVATFKDIDGDPKAFLDEFAHERQRSLEWLGSLGSLDAIDWDRAHHHPKGFVIQAGDLLSAWPDHDTLHARQIIKRHHQLIERAAGGYTCIYAGEW
ncbi:MAG: DinB family protein [Planctomycetota bacterium]